MVFLVVNGTIFSSRFSNGSAASHLDLLS